MSAETLRRAAALMRERAEAIDDWYTAEAWATTAPMNLPIEKADAAYIASWHPAVAVAVADLLGEIALRWEYVEERELALAVARAYLGEGA